MCKSFHLFPELLILSISSSGIQQSNKRVSAFDELSFYIRREFIAASDVEIQISTEAVI